ncbi:MAG: hypothetical protein F6K44_27505 [Moorea sp. SIO3E2]|nr:hypothetical protein [Moorena sp. SIO3E2]
MNISRLKAREWILIELRSKVSRQPSAVSGQRSAVSRQPSAVRVACEARSLNAPKSRGCVSNRVTHQSQYVSIQLSANARSVIGAFE